MLKITLIIIIYILSVWLARKCTLIAYKDMIYQLNNLDMLSCLLPIVNIAAIITYPFIIASEKRENKKRTASDWFFKK